MPYVTPEELVNKSPGEIITLYLNRANETEFLPSQLDHMRSQRMEDEDGPFIEVIVMPKPITGWQRGPITVKLPVFSVADYYADKEIKVEYSALGKLGKVGTFLRDFGAPPSKALRIEEGIVQEEENGKYTVIYFASYDNIFFTGSIPIKVVNVPKLLSALKVVNAIFLNPENLN